MTQGHRPMSCGSGRHRSTLREQGREGALQERGPAARASAARRRSRSPALSNFFFIMVVWIYLVFLENRRVFFCKRTRAMAERHAPTFWRRTGRATKGQQLLMLGVLFVAGPCAAECTQGVRCGRKQSMPSSVAVGPRSSPPRAELARTQGAHRGEEARDDRRPWPQARCGARP